MKTPPLLSQLSVDLEGLTISSRFILLWFYFWSRCAQYCRLILLAWLLVILVAYNPIILFCWWQMSRLLWQSSVSC